MKNLQNYRIIKQDTEKEVSVVKAVSITDALVQFAQNHQMTKMTASMNFFVDIVR